MALAAAIVKVIPKENWRDFSLSTTKTKIIATSYCAFLPPVVHTLAYKIRGRTFGWKSCIAEMFWLLGIYNHNFQNFFCFPNQAAKAVFHKQVLHTRHDAAGATSSKTILCQHFNKTSTSPFRVGEIWWTSCKSFPPPCRGYFSSLAVCMECKAPRISRPMGCWRTKLRDSMFIPSGQDRLSFCRFFSRCSKRHTQGITHESSFSTLICSVQDLIHAFAFAIQAKESAALARYAYVSWDAAWCSHLFCYGIAWQCDCTSLSCSFLFSHVLPSFAVYFETFWCL